MADEKIIIQIEADGKGADKALDNLGKKATSVGEGIEKGFKGVFGKSGAEIAELGTKFTLVAGTVGIAAKALKEFSEAIFNAALEGEKIKVINSQFEFLAKQAGISGNAIGNALVEAADGLADTEDILQAASKGIVTFGENAERLPEIFQLARQASQVFGGDIVDRFEQLSQAIASGQTRALKNLGIIVDSGKAYEDFAKSIGVTASSLTEVQKQQVLLNAVLEKGKSSFDGVDLNANKLQQSSTRLSVALGELKDTSSILANNIFGDLLQSVLSRTADSFNNFNLAVKDITGIATKEEQLTLLNQRLDEQNKLLEFARVNLKGDVEFRELSIAKIKEEITALTERNDAQNEADFQRALKKPQGGGVETTPEQDQQIAQNQINQQNAIRDAFLQAERDKLSAIQQRIGFTTDEEIKLQQQLTAIQIQENILRTEDEIKKQALLKTFEDNKITDKAIQNELLLAQEISFQEQLANLDTQTNNIRLQNQNTFKSGFISAQQEALKQLRGLDSLGKTVFNSYKNNAVSAFLAVGEGSKTAGEAVKAITFGVIADTAQAKGTEMILAGIWPPNPPAIAGGAALIALAGALRSKSSGGSDLSGGTPSASGGGASIGSASSPEAAADAVQEKTTAVQIDVQGTVLNPIQVGQQIAQILNDTFDATGTRVTTGVA